MQLNYFTYKKEDFTCPHCGWKGKGHELRQVDFNEVHLIGDLDCPRCYEHIGFWQAPTMEKMKEWKIQNPDWDQD